MEDRIELLEHTLRQQVEQTSLLLRNQKILAEDFHDQKRQLDVEVIYLQKQIEELEERKQDSDKPKKAGKKGEKKKQGKADTRDE